jgi:arginine/lysine/ornithine decarboxylase
MNRQDFVIKSLKHYFLNRELCSYSPGGSPTCLYRGPNKTKCAIGQHIPDELYDSRMEAFGNFHLVMEALSDEAKAQGLNESQWMAIQSVHDGLASNSSLLETRISHCELQCSVDLTELKNIYNEHYSKS